MYLSVIVPIYNEGLILRKNLINIHKCFQNSFDFEILVVDDGSKDDSIKILNHLNLPNVKTILNDKNYGKGFSITKGIVNSIGDFVLVTDADLSTPINEFFKLKSIIENNNFDFVIGSRNMLNSKVIIKQSKKRIIMGGIFNFLVQKILSLKYYDTQCGFKLFNGDKIREIVKYTKINGFCIDVEILYIAEKFNYKIFEIGVIWKNDNRSSVNLLFDPIKMFFDLIKIRLRNY